MSKYGGTIVAMDSSPKPTHIVFDESLHDKKLDVQRVLNIIKVTCDEIPSSKLVSPDWLCQSVKAKKLQNTEPFEFQPKVREIALVVDAVGHCEKTSDRGKRFDPRDDAWLWRMAMLHRGFFNSGTIPKYD